VTGTERVPEPTAPRSQQALTPVAPRVSNWNVANGLTGLRIVLVPLFAWLLLAGDGRTGWRLAAAATFVVAVLTDTFDGKLARRHGLVTDVGKMADPIADKALIGTALVALSLMAELPWWVTLVVIGREAAITALRFVVIRHGVMPAGKGGKAKTATQSVAIVMYLLPLPAWGHAVAVAVMAVAVVLTVGSGLDYLVKAYRLRAGSELTRRRREERAARTAGSPDGR
jgi:CDP-diacylglycerol--glycerol-3-phosphate 3-phosphatidyltransferase